MLFMISLCGRSISTAIGFASGPGGWGVQRIALGQISAEPFGQMRPDSGFFGIRTPLTIAATRTSPHCRVVPRHRFGGFNNAAALSHTL
jgi:hypothetical protein